MNLVERIDVMFFGFLCLLALFCPYKKRAASAFWNRNLHPSRRRQSSRQASVSVGKSIDLDVLPTSEDQPIGLYIHIPYCRRRCRYCNFAIVPIGTRPFTEYSSSSPLALPDDATRGFEKMNDSYLQCLVTELQRIQRKTNGTKIPLESIYFGGGTPSLAPIDTIATILKEAYIHDHAPFCLRPGAEISIEMDPGTFTRNKLQKLKDLGINRISLGVQSFDDSLLEQIGRIHRKKDVYESLEAIRVVFGPNPNYSIDLISGLPGLTQTKWLHTLMEATSIQPRPSHMSIYDLQIEQGTVFSNWYDRMDAAATQTTKIPSLPTEDDCAFMYKYAAGYLKSKNYEHYEVSSYASRSKGIQAESSRRSRHNQIYWATSSSWYAIGLGATSFVDGRLVARPKTLVDYESWVNTKGQNSDSDEGAGKKMKEEEYLTDVVMKRLRTSDGLDLEWVQQRFGTDITNSILDGAAMGLDLGLVEIEEFSGERKILRLRDPDGFLFSNFIISSIFAELGYE